MKRAIFFAKIPPPAGKEIWQQSTVLNILRNEKYKGDAILQKSFTVDFLTKKKKVNEGEVPKYYVENSHPAIITPEVFDLVQHEMKKRKNAKGYKTGGSCFSSKIVCGKCGSFYGSKVWHSTSKYLRVIWQCNSKFKNDEKCKTPHIYEDTLKHAFIEGFNSILKNKAEILKSYEPIIQALTDTSKLDKQNELKVAEDLLRKCVEENACNALNQTEYEERYKTLVEQYENIKKRLEGINEKGLELIVKHERTITFIKELEQKEKLVLEFDENLWSSIIEKVLVHSEERITFIFKDNMELEWNI